MRETNLNENAWRLINYLNFKMDCAREQEENPWVLDVEKAQYHLDELVALQEEKVQELKSVMPKVRKYKNQNRPKEIYKKDGSVSVVGQRWLDALEENGLSLDTEETTVKVFSYYEEPNPNSTDQVKAWLYSLGWEPCTFKYDKDKETGKERKIEQVRKDGELTPSVSVLVEKHPELKPLEGLTVIQHRKSIFEAFLECHLDGYLKSEIAGLTNTFRFKHMKPIVNLPGVDKPWGKEIRGCLRAPEGYSVCGTDMVSLESTTKRHFIYPYDPDYADEMSKEGFDEHLSLAVDNGEITQEEYDFYVWYENSDL